MLNSLKSDPNQRAKGFTLSNPFRAVFLPFAHTKKLQGINHFFNQKIATLKLDF